jgi:Cu(I)-responsive transcriptional regulator
MVPEEPLTIGKIAGATGTKVETVRYYERIGLLPLPRRTRGNYRSYDADHLNRLAFIRRSRDLGFTIEQIKELLDLADQNERSCSAVDAIARQHLGEVERKIADLERLAQELRQLSEQCRGGTIAECRILDALSPEPRPSPTARASAALAFLLAGFVLFAAQAASAAPGDPERGARAFRVCSAFPNIDHGTANRRLRARSDHRECIVGAVRLTLLEVSLDLSHLVCDMREAQDRFGSCPRKGVERRCFHLDGQHALSAGRFDGGLSLAEWRVGGPGSAPMDGDRASRESPEHRLNQCLVCFREH